MNVSITVVLLAIGTFINCAFCQTSIGEPTSSKEPLFSFGVVADAQYVDADKIGKRNYRQSLEKLNNSMNIFNDRPLSFVINLGDLIDRDHDSFSRIMPVLYSSKATVHNVMGNHDFSVDEKYKPGVRKLLNNKRGYFSFDLAGFRFLVLDGSDVSLFAYRPQSSAYKKASASYERLKGENANNAETWNGGFGKKQLKWINKQLAFAEKKGDKVVIFCHWPLLPSNGAQLWNSGEVLHLLKGSSSVIAWFSGHHHAGNYVEHSKVHHLTFKGLVEAVSSTSCSIVDVYSDRLVVNGYGDQENFILPF